MDKEYLSVLGEDGSVIGTALRNEIHEMGLLHAEIHVWFITPNKDLIFQRRAQDKDTYPGKLDATVGGHVEIDDTYEQSALREIEEETGLKLLVDDLVLVDEYKGRSYDNATNTTNNALRRTYAYVYTGDVNDLTPEVGKIDEFKQLSINDVYSHDYEKDIIPVLRSPRYSGIYAKLLKLIDDNKE